MSYNGSGTFVINTSGQPVVAGTVISSTAFNALTADLATGLSTAITKDGQTTATARIPFAQGISSTLTTDSSSVSTGSIITAGGLGVAKALYVGTTANVGSTTDSSSISTGSIVTAGGAGVAKALYVGTTLNVAGNASFTSTGAVLLSKGTTAQQPAGVAGSLRFNTDTNTFEGYNGTAWTAVGGGATGGGADQIFIQNQQTVTVDYTITTSYNAMSTGPISINSGITVTVPSSSNWVVL